MLKRSNLPDLSPSITPNPQPTSTVSQTNTPTATSTFTKTPTPTLTFTQTPTFTPTPNSISILVDRAVIYSGPGEAYDLLAVYSKEITIFSVGRSEDENWFVINLPDRQGWVEANNVSANFEVEVLPVFEIPPTPLPSLTPTPSPKIIYFLTKELNLQDVHNFHLENFLPNEDAWIEVINAETGEVVWKIPGGG